MENKKNEKQFTIIKNVELEKSCMAFKLKDGKILLIDREDVSEIARDIKMSMMLDRPQYTLMISDPFVQRAKELYAIFKMEKDGMTAELRMDYLKRILDLETNLTFGVETFEEYMKKNGIPK